MNDLSLYFTSLLLLPTHYGMSTSKHDLEIKEYHLACFMNSGMTDKNNFSTKR